MIREAHGNLLDAKAEALVNTVNTVGVMGKGIALQFKRAYPANYKAYKRACDQEAVQLGRMFIWDAGALGRGGPRYIINFPTKRHWRSKSKPSDDPCRARRPSQASSRTYRSRASPFPRWDAATVACAGTRCAHSSSRLSTKSRT